MTRVRQVGNLSNVKPGGRKNPNPNRVYLVSGISPSLKTMQGGNRQPLIIVKDRTKTNKIIYIGNVNPSGRGQNGSVVDSRGLARAVTTEKGEGQKVLVEVTR